MKNVKQDRARDLLLVLGACAMTAAAIAVVVSLHVRADRARQAQVSLGHINTDAGLLATVPLVALYESPKQGAQLLADARSAIDQQLLRLEASGSTDELERIRATTRVFAADIESILPLLTLFVQQGGNQVASLPDPRSVAGYSEIQTRFIREHDAQKEAIRSAADSYDRAANRANVEAYIGSALTVLLACLGFSALLRSLSRSREQARTLADENARLLGRARVESETDALTGLANRRKLMMDLEQAVAGEDGATAVVVTIFDLDGFKYYNDTFGHPAGDRLLARLGAELANAAGPEATAYRMGGDEFCLVSADDGSDQSLLLQRASRALSDDGGGFSITASLGSARVPREVLTVEQALNLADQRLYADKPLSPLRGTRQARDVLLQAQCERDPDLEPHLNRVALLAERVARRCGLNDRKVTQIRLAAELHDIGKVAIPDAVLDKTEPLSDEDWLMIRQHTLIGERIVGAAGDLREVARLVRSSHERVDGNGYPDRLVGDEIPLGSRIINVCDAYDAIIGDRPYRPARTSQEALEELARCAGHQFDPVLVALVIDEVNANTLRM